MKKIILATCVALSTCFVACTDDKTSETVDTPTLEETIEVQDEVDEINNEIQELQETEQELDDLGSELDNI